MQKQEFDTLSPYDNFVYALRAKETERQYLHRLDKFLSFLGLEGTIPQKCTKLYEIGKDGSNGVRAAIATYLVLKASARITKF
jgi:hypothetical protein